MGNVLEEDIGATQAGEGDPVGFGGDARAPRRVEESGQREYGADSPEQDLRLGQREHSLGGASHALLSFKVGILALLGVLCAVPGAWGLTLILDRQGRWDQILGFALLALSFPATASFYGWAVYGDPATLWAWDGPWRLLGN